MTRTSIKNFSPILVVLFYSLSFGQVSSELPDDIFEPDSELKVADIEGTLTPTAPDMMLAATDEDEDENQASQILSPDAELLEGCECSDCTQKRVAMGYWDETAWAMAKNQAFAKRVVSLPPTQPNTIPWPPSCFPNQAANGTRGCPLDCGECSDASGCTDCNCESNPLKESRRESDQQCVELAETLAESLSDSKIDPASQRMILETTLKLLVRNAELEARAETAEIQLRYERELANLRSQNLQMRTYTAQLGEVKNWIGPIYANQNQNQIELRNLTSNVELIQRRMAARDAQPIHIGNPFSTQQPATQERESVRPERWSQLPAYQQNPPRNRIDKSTRYQPPAVDTSTQSSRQLVPQRISETEIQEQRRQSEIRRLKTALNEIQTSPTIRPVSWNAPLPSNPLKPLPAQPQQLRR